MTRSRFLPAIACFFIAATINATAQGSCPVDKSTSYNVKICSPQPRELVATRVTASFSAYSANSPITAAIVNGKKYDVNATEIAMDVTSDLFLASNEPRSINVQVWNANGEKSEETVFIYAGATPGTCKLKEKDVLNWCDPGLTGTVTSPVKIVANVNWSTFSGHIKVYADGVERYNGNSAEVYTLVDLALGAHNIVIQAWDYRGVLLREERSVTVVSRDSACAPMSGDGVQICQPVAGQSESAPLRLTARTSSGGAPITYMRLYRDALPIWEGEYSRIDTDLHYGLLEDRTAQYGLVAWNQLGQAFVDVKNVTVKGFMPPPFCAIPADRTVTLCAPSPGAMVPSMAIVSARARWEGKKISAFRVYVDYEVKFPFGTGSSSIDSIYWLMQLSPGTHRVVVVAWTLDGDVMVSEEKRITVY
ncbi:MAG TPA: hypothetical protein VMZ25_00555 [Terriglobales bacterium]|nr:hypothetical protein [Terriglobales bacterium]